MSVGRLIGLFAVGVGLFACGSSTPAPTAPATPPSGPPVVVGTVKDETGARVQGIPLVVNDGRSPDPHVIGDGVSDEHGEFRFDVEIGDAVLYVQVGEKSQQLLETFHAGENRVDVVVDSATVAKARSTAHAAVCPSSKPGTLLAGHTTSQKDIDELTHAILERGQDAIPDYPLASRVKGDIRVIAQVGHHRQLSTNALPPGFALADATALQAEANLSRNQIGYIELDDIWSDGTCATVVVGGDIAVPADPNVIKMCCCKASAIYEKRAGTWVFVKNAYTMCS